MDFSKCIYGDTGMGILLFASPHPRMQGLTTSSQLEHKLYFISQSSSRKRREREKKKISLLNVVLGTEHFLHVYMEAILLYGSLAETLKHECSEGENINWSAVMKFP